MDQEKKKSVFIVSVGYSTCSLAADVPAKPVLNPLCVCIDKKNAIKTVKSQMSDIAAKYNVSKETLEWGTEKFGSQLEHSSDGFITFGLAGQGRYVRFDAKIDQVPLLLLSDTMTWYGVEQSKYGHCHQWIFDEETISREMYDGEPVIDGDCMDVSWPLAGSNSCSTSIVKMESPKEIEDFLLGTSMCEYDDPSLCDIAEYYKTVECDHESWTQFWLNKLNLTRKMCEQCDDAEEHFSRAKEMIDVLENVKDRHQNDSDQKWDDLYKVDYDNPWYGQSYDLRFSELQDLYRKYCVKEETA